LAKRKKPKKRPPHAACFLRSEGFERGFSKGHPSPYEKRDASLHRPYRADPSKPSGARRGIRGLTPTQNSSLSIVCMFDFYLTDGYREDSPAIGEEDGI